MPTRAGFRISRNSTVSWCRRGPGAPRDFGIAVAESPLSVLGVCLGHQGSAADELERYLHTTGSPGPGEPAPSVRHGEAE